MSIKIGQKLPDSILYRLGGNGPETINFSSLYSDRKLAIFGLPGAFTTTCSKTHLPSILDTATEFSSKGIDEILCISVNDPHVVAAWGEISGATAAGITMLGDPLSEFTKAIGMEFDAPAVGFLARSKRYAMFAEDGVVKIFLPETGRSTCDISSGKALLENI